jgi:DNA-binding transcriptional MerR regulator
MMREARVPSIDIDLFKRIYSSTLLYGIRMKRVDIPIASVSPNPSSGAGALSGHGAHTPAFNEHKLAAIEARYPDGISTQEIVELFAAEGERLSEATFRKYVQLGLLPRSVRVGRKGKHRGSQGRYPASVVRQIDAVRLLMAQGFTIQHIQREFMNLRSDIDALSRQLSQLMASLTQAVSERESSAPDDVLARALDDARSGGAALIERLRAIEQRLAMRARMARAAV